MSSPDNGCSQDSCQPLDFLRMIAILNFFCHHAKSCANALKIEISANPAEILTISLRINFTASFSLLSLGTGIFPPHNFTVISFRKIQWSKLKNALDSPRRFVVLKEIVFLTRVHTPASGGYRSTHTTTPLLLWLL